MSEAVVWAYRLLLNRDPENAAVVGHYDGMALPPAALVKALTDSEEFHTLLDRAGRPFEARGPVDVKSGAPWAIRYLLGREPTGAADLQALAGATDVNDLRLKVLLGPEFERRAGRLAPLRDVSVVNAFAPFPDREPIPGAFVDVLGTRTQVAYLDPSMAHRSGAVDDGVPRPSAPGLHGTLEWIAALRSVLEARGRLCVIELGAGWGPWLVACARAAALKGITELDLTGVEGSAEHHGFMRDHFRRNGLDPDAHRLIHGVVGVRDGPALFPALADARADYGANAVLADDEHGAAAARGALTPVACRSLTTLLADRGRVDLVHMDIQGHEADVVESAIDALTAQVRRLVVGTHGRAVEARLFDVLGGAGWTLEADQACRMEHDADGRLHQSVDGEQVWRNDRVRRA